MLDLVTAGVEALLSPQKSNDLSTMALAAMATNVFFICCCRVAVDVAVAVAIAVAVAAVFVNFFSLSSFLLSSFSPVIIRDNVRKVGTI